MLLIIAINVFVIGGLCYLAFNRGLERALPFATFMLVFLPIECRISLGAFELTIQRVILVVLGALYLFLGSRNKATANVAMPLKVLMCVHVAWCLISTADSIVVLASIKKLMSVVFEYYLLYFVYWKNISSVKTIYKILFAIVLALIISSVFGTIEAYRGWQILSLLPIVSHRFGGGISMEADREVRVQVTFDHAILYGAALAMAILLALYLLNVYKKGSEKVLVWGGLLLMFLNIYKTSSRGPWLDVIIGCALLLLVGGKNVRNRVLVIVLLSVAVCVIRPGVWHTIEGIYDNTMNDNTDTGSSYEYRYALPKAAIKKTLEAPSRTLWGYGLESFYDAHVEGQFLGKPHMFLSADDAWAELLVETGFVGLLIILLLLFTPAVIAWKEFRKTRGPEKYLCSVLLINLLVFYLQMYSVGMYSWGQNGYMLWVLIAAIMAFRTVRKAEARAINAKKSDVDRIAKPEIALQPLSI